PELHACFNQVRSSASGRPLKSDPRVAPPLYRLKPELHACFNQVRSSASGFPLKSDPSGLDTRCAQRGSLQFHSQDAPDFAVARLRDCLSLKIKTPPTSSARTLKTSPT